MDYELLRQGPAVYIPVLLVSLIVTVVAYGAFPFLFAEIRRFPVTRRKYRGLCYGVNVAVMLLFIAINGGASSAGPYFLWTWVFTNYGTRKLGSRGLLTVAPQHKDYPKPMNECRSCGYRNRNSFDVCPKCGEYVRQCGRLTGEPDVDTDKIRFCRSCGGKLITNSRFCGKCGTNVIKE